MKVLFALIMFVQMDTGSWMAAKAQQFETLAQCQAAGELAKNTYKMEVPSAIKHMYKCIELKGDS